VNRNLPLLQLLQPRIEKLEILNANLLGRTRQLRLLILLARTSPKGVLEVRVDGIVGFTFALGERNNVQVQRLALLEGDVRTR
jgi:hypothetical protein